MKCRFTGTFDRLPDQFCQLLGRRSGHYSARAVMGASKPPPPPPPGRAPRLHSDSHVLTAAPDARRRRRTTGLLLGTGDDALPVMLYGTAHPDGRSLAQLRRSLGYFSGASSGVRAQVLGLREREAGVQSQGDRIQRTQFTEAPLSRRV